MACLGTPVYAYKSRLRGFQQPTKVGLANVDRPFKAVLFAFFSWRSWRLGGSMMKGTVMGRAFVLALVMLASGLLLYWLLAPRFLTPATPSGPQVAPPTADASIPGGTSPNVPGGSTTTPGTSVNTAPAVETPRSPAQRSSDDREAKRGPFYGWIRENFSKVLVGWQPDPRDPATLELYTANDDPQLSTQLLASLVQPYAAHYGFNHVMFYLPNSSSNVDHFRLDAEATFANNTWQLFRK